MTSGRSRTRAICSEQRLTTYGSEDVLERPAALVLANDVGRDALVRGLRACEEIRKNEPMLPEAIVSLSHARSPSVGAVCGARRRRIDDGGARSGSSSGSSGARMGRGPSVERSIPRTARPASRVDDLIFEGYELEDALDHANEALEDEVRVSRRRGSTSRSRPSPLEIPKLEHAFSTRCRRVLSAPPSRRAC